MAKLSPLYSTYRNLQNRCGLDSYIKKHRYKDRGIKCEWESFIDFEKDMLETYLIHVEKFGKEDTSLDRIDNDGNYCKNNCRWATQKEQQNNRQNNKRFYGKTLSEWSEIIGVKRSTLAQRLYCYKWDIDKVLNFNK